MDKLEKIEKIREKTGVNYQLAKEALEEAEGDVLDALVWLEKRGKVEEPEVSVYTTEEESASDAFTEAAKEYDDSTKDTFSDYLKRFISWCGVILKKGCENFFIIKKHEDEVVSMPVLLLAILLICAFWITMPLMVAGLFFGFRYSFKGEIAKAVDVNTACDKAAETAENIKQEFTK